MCVIVEGSQCQSVIHHSQGEAEAVLNRSPLPTDRHKLYFAKQQWRVTNNDTLSIGHLAHQSPMFMKISGKNIAFERELVMGEQCIMFSSKSSTLSFSSNRVHYVFFKN